MNVGRAIYKVVLNREPESDDVAINVTNQVAESGIDVALTSMIQSAEGQSKGKKIEDLGKMKIQVYLLQYSTYIVLALVAIVGYYLYTKIGKKGAE